MRQDTRTACRASACTPRPRERLWTLVKGGKRVDAELLFHGEYGVEVGLIRFRGHFPKGGYDVHAHDRDAQTAAIASPVR